MNAVIALCHFCELHGPCPIFCTQTLRECKIEELQIDLQHNSNKPCSACNSLGQTNCIYSTDEESGAMLFSSQIPVLPEVASLIKQASVRSLSCEINTNKDGGFVFFGDALRGHVLSHTFHVADLQARGFYQQFSIIILMKDKYFLLNIKPFLAENLTNISKEIQSSAQKIKENDESKGNPRQNRNCSGSQLLMQTPRSLVELTGEENIFAILHSHFSWILLAGSRYLTENVTFGKLPWLTSNADTKSYTVIKLPNNKSEDTQDELLSLRYLKAVLNDDFILVCYCALIGIKIVVRGPQDQTFHLLMCLKKLLPEPMHHLICTGTKDHPNHSDCKIISVPSNAAVPIASRSLLRIELFEGQGRVVNWVDELPPKLPDLIIKLVKATNEPLLTNLVLNKQTKVLVEEWKNKIICINRARSLSGINKLKKVVGIQQHDELLVNYWTPFLK